MKYLSFDIECCDGKHICEFGYVIVDEKFNTIKKECFTINPEKPFNLIGRENREDCVLFFPEETYYANQPFSAFYNKIKSIISTKDSIIFGHAMKSDASFLRTACKRYHLPPLNFNFIDSQRLYKEFSGIKKDISLENAEVTFKLDKPQFHHKSDDDALLTLKFVEKICKELSVSVPELIDLCPTAHGKSLNFDIQYASEDLESWIKTLWANPTALSQKKTKICIQRFAETVLPQKQIDKSILNDKKLCFSLSFEKSNPIDTLKLIQVLADHGCKYNTKVSENDYYVASNEELSYSIPIEKTRYFTALKEDNDKNIKILSFDEFLSLINLTESDLKKIGMPTIPHKGNKKRVSYSKNKEQNTIGNYLRAQGIDLSKLF